MALPSREKNEDKNKFMTRCMTDANVKKQFKDDEQLIEACLQKACEGMDYVQAADFQIYFSTYGSEEELDSNNLYIPKNEEYVSAEEVFYEESEVEEWDIAENKPGLWENIRKKKEREGKDYRPAKKGDPDRPDPDAWKKAQSQAGDGGGEGGMSKSQLKKIAMQAMELYNMMTDDMEVEAWVQDSISKAEAHMSSAYDYMKYTDVKETEKDDENEEAYAAEYQGRKVKLGKPFRTPKGPKKFSVYVKNDKGNVVKVNFGDPNMKIKKSDPARRKSFRARHNCDNPGPRWKARYWSCRAW